MATAKERSLDGACKNFFQAMCAKYDNLPEVTLICCFLEDSVRSFELDTLLDIHTLRPILMRILASRTLGGQAGGPVG